MNDIIMIIYLFCLDIHYYAIYIVCYIHIYFYHYGLLKLYFTFVKLNLMITSHVYYIIYIKNVQCTLYIQSLSTLYDTPIYF